MKTAEAIEAPVKLLLGGRTTRIPGFTNIDLFEGENVDIRTDVSDLSMFKDKTVDEIYASHLLEHFHHVRTLYVLEEWHRVLRKGGKAYISVPDFDAIVQIYKTTGLTQWIKNILFGDQIYDLAFHYAPFTFASLAKTLTEAGFSDVKRINSMPYALGDCSTLVDNITRRQVSLSVEATA